MTIVVILLAVVFGACAAEDAVRTSETGAAPGDAAAVETGVRALLDEQEAAWNRGDLEGFMAGYWHSDELRFASGGDVTFGWEPTLERYRMRYPDRAAMGTLTFSEIDVTPLGDRHALAFGRFTLERESDRPTGLFSLVLEHRAEGWRIVHDHTSSGEPAGE